MQRFVATHRFSPDSAVWAACRLYQLQVVFIVSLARWHIRRRLIRVGGVGRANAVDARRMCFLERVGFLLHLPNHFKPSWSRRTGCSHHRKCDCKNSAGAAERLARPGLAGGRTEPGIIVGEKRRKKSGWVVYPLGITGSHNSRNWTPCHPLGTNGKLSSRSYIKFSLLNKGNNMKLTLKFTRINLSLLSNKENLERNTRNH